MSKKVSVITPVWNKADLTARFILEFYSLYANYEGVELIIINNGSTDYTDRMLSNWKTILGEQLKIVALPENKGFAGGNNAGAAVATGNVLAFISNDVRIQGDFLTPLQVLFRYDQGKVLFGPEIWSQDTGWNNFNETGPIPYVAGWCVVVDRDQWDNGLCKWDERYFPCDYEDIDLSYQVTQAGGRLQKIEGLPLYHESGKTAADLPGGRLRVTEQNREKFQNKWGLTRVK